MSDECGFVWHVEGQSLYTHQCVKTPGHHNDPRDIYHECVCGVKKHPKEAR